MQDTNNKSIISTIVSFILLLLMSGAAVFSNFFGFTKASASGLSIEQEDLVLYEGNKLRLNLIYNDQEYFQDTDDFYYDYYAYFDSADSDIVRVYYDGTIECTGTGKTVIKAYYGGLTAECTVKVKANKFKLSDDELTLYSNQSKDVKLSGIKNIKEYDCEVRLVDYSVPYYTEDYPKVEAKGKGVFTITAGRSGIYEIRLIGKKKNGTSYSKKLILNTVRTGPESKKISVAEGCSNELDMINSEIVKVEFLKWYDGDNFFEASEYGNGGYVSADDNGIFTAETNIPYETSSYYRVYYKTDDGTKLYTDITVTPYLPVYNKFESYLWVGQTYEPNITDLMSSSKVVCTSSDTSIIDVNENGDIVPVKSGSATLTINVDGKEFKDEVSVIDVHAANGDVLLTWPGTKFSYKVSGVPSDVKVTYKSSDPTVASISKKGTLKTKKKGYTIITVTVDGNEMNYTVNVGDETSVKAVLWAGEQQGSKYDQSRRMEEGYFDCSSLAWRSYAFAGLKIKETSYAPSSADLAKYLDDNGYTIAKGDLSPEELLPGDFLFFSSGRDNGRFMKIDHVALYYGAVGNVEYYDYWTGEYVSGLQGQLIHAGTGGGGVYFSSYPQYGGAVLIARIDTNDK
ncbi:MAG: Ig-like domain-containing protein [Lachnospiraceae bacterium]|nr:Ig-like domain-containing protein [Lachnospiraceae bacterium]